MDVSIILVNYNTLKLTKECIQSIIEKTHGCVYEIILVDNASTDGSKDFFSTFNGIKYIYNEENLGFGKANNLGYRYSSGDYILCLNTDTVLREDSISKMVEFSRSKRLSVLGSKLIDNFGNKMHSYGCFLPSIKWELDMNCYLFSVVVSIFYRLKILLSSYCRVGYITGADLLIKKSVIDECGFFDPDFFMYFEEAELQFRFQNHGYYSYLYKGTSIVHLEGKSTRVKRNREIMYFNSRKLYYTKSHGKLYCRIVDHVYESCMSIRIISATLVGNRELLNSLKEKYSIYKQVSRL